jgi:hypothetical protein
VKVFFAGPFIHDANVEPPTEYRSGVLHSVNYFRRAVRFSASEAMNSSVDW